MGHAHLRSLKVLPLFPSAHAGGRDGGEGGMSIHEGAGQKQPLQEHTLTLTEGLPDPSDSVSLGRSRGAGS